MAIDGPDGFEQVIASYPLVIAEFHAEWCGPCQLLAPILESIAGDPEAVVATVDVDANSEIVFARRVRSVPLVELYHTGERVERLVGSRFEQELREVIRTDRTG